MSAHNITSFVSGQAGANGGHTYMSAGRRWLIRRTGLRQADVGPTPTKGAASP